MGIAPDKKEYMEHLEKCLREAHEAIPRLGTHLTFQDFVDRCRRGPGALREIAIMYNNLVYEMQNR